MESFVQAKNHVESKPNGIFSKIKSTLKPYTLITRQISHDDIWKFLIIFRCINACLVQTFFQPDEFYQSLEPAWQMAFGTDSGAWITWEWKLGLRSSLHPSIFAVVYFVAEKLIRPLNSFPHVRSQILTKLPNLVQAYFAASGEFYTWQLAEKIYGQRSYPAWTTLIMSVLSPWQWFFSTRTFSNNLEMTLTLAAFNLWPWSLLSNAKLNKKYDGTSERDTSRESELNSLKQSRKSTKQLRICLLLAGTACILRPTNLLIWISFLVPQISDLLTRTPRLPSIGNYFFLIRQGLFCSVFLLIISAIFDRFYFTAWIFPPYNWLHFNLVQDIAVFYGTNTWHYYLTQGLPQLLVTYLPFTLISIWNSLTLPSNDIRFVLTTTAVITVGFLSLISHKEVRFIYPLLPIFFILTAPTMSRFFANKPSITKQDVKTIKPKTTGSFLYRFRFHHVSLLISLLLINILTAFYVTIIHQSGVITIMPHIRKTFETSFVTKDTSSHLNNNPINDSIPFVAFLMPCHSTPFRSALIHPNLTAWALTCSPPLHIAPHTAARLSYRDEADRFYDDPIKFLRQEVGTKEGRNWPLFIVGFEGIESELRAVWESHGPGQKTNKIVENKRVFNSHWHDDPRRKGDVVLWELIRNL